MSSPDHIYPFRHLLADLRRMLRPYRGRFWLAFWLRLTSDLVWLIPAWILSEIVNLLTDNPTSESFTRIGWLLALWAGLGIYHFITHELAKYVGFQVAEGLALDARVATLRKLFGLDFGWHQLENSGNKLKRIAKGAEGLDELLRIFYTNVIESVVNVIGMSLVFLWLNLPLGLVTLLYVVVYYYLSFRLTRRASNQAYLVHAKEENLEGASFEAINNIRTVKAMELHNPLMEHVHNLTEAARGAIRRRIGYFRQREGILNFLTLGFELLGVGWLAWQITQGRYELGLLILFLQYARKLDSAAFELAEVTHKAVLAKIGIHRMMDIQRTEPAIVESPTQQAFDPHWKNLQLVQVAFSYEGEDVLKGLDLSIRRGEKIGLVGHSGAGKSTLFKLLLDLYEDYDGTIGFDGTDLRQISRQSYVDELAVVLQETELFNLSFRENITLAASSRSQNNEAELTRVIQAAHLTEVVARLPQGLDTPVGEKGIKLSGGERQRLGIARALYRRPSILLLDEATSSLDSASESAIQAALHDFFQNVTAIVIAHRLATIREMDRIIVLDQGRIVEQGRFDALLKQKGTLYRLWEEQKL